jgi:hypothetical protein
MMRAISTTAAFVLLSLASAFAQGQAQTAPQTAPAPVPATSQAVQLQTFTDPDNSVSFQYPATWKLSQQSAFQQTPAIVQQGLPLQAVVTFPPAGTPFAQTNLDGLEFVYTVAPQTNQPACMRLLSSMSSTPTSAPSSFDTVPISGIPFLHVTSSGAGMCHQVKSIVYAASRAGKCYLFETDTHTLCAGVVDGTHELTPLESARLARTLNSILQSVTIGTPK